MPQLRQNIITGEWVVIAPERAKRPSDFVSAAQPRPDSDEACPFCLEHENYTKNRLPHYETDQIYVIPNKFPAFVEDARRCSERSYRVEDDFFLARPSLGGHDVVIVKKHDLELADFNREIWRDLLVISRKRYQHFDQLCNNAYTMMIYNEKAPAGASILHPHAQIFSSNIVPNLIARELQQTESYYEEHGVSAFTDLISHEKKFGKRVLYESADYLAFTQYAARFPFETWIVPKFQQARFDHIASNKLAALVPVLLNVLKKINSVLHNPPLNLFIHSAPNAIEEVDYFRWHIEIAPRLATYGGYELGSGVIIDVVSPEQAAAYLNEQHH